MTDVIIKGLEILTYTFTGGVIAYVIVKAVIYLT